VIVGEGACWKPIGRFSLQSLPGALAMAASPEEVRAALRRSGLQVYGVLNRRLLAPLQEWLRPPV
jgi:hypothetical protein